MNDYLQSGKLIDIHLYNVNKTIKFKRKDVLQTSFYHFRHLLDYHTTT